MELSELKNERVAVLGLGQEGQATVRYLIKHGCSPVLFDQKDYSHWEEEVKELITLHGLEYFYGQECFTSLKEFDPTDTAFLVDVYATVQNIVKEHQLPAYRLILNGGEYQDFPQLHFHLIAGVEGSKLNV